MKTTIRKTKRGRIIEGESKVCCHRISWWYEIPKIRMNDGLIRVFEEAAEDRAQVCIIDGCSSGQLCCGVGDRSFCGWFEIIQENLV